MDTLKYETPRQDHYCTCRFCRPRAETVGLPLPYIPTSELVEQLKTLSKSTIADYKALCLRTAKLAPEILERWSNFGTEEREQVLKRADPDMPLHHRPELDSYEALLSGQDLTSEEVESLQRIFDCPYWTVEDVCHRENLLILLERRTTKMPGYFATFDLEQAGIAAAGHTSNSRDCFKGCAVSLPRLTNQGYGALHNQTACRAVDIPFSQAVGFAAVEIQNRLYRKLLGVTSVILEDFDLSEAALEQRKNADVPTLVPGRTSDPSDCLMAAPFYGTAEMNSDFVDALVSAGNHAALSHLLHLRESPAFLRSSVRDWIKHIGWKRDSEGKAESDCTTAVALMVHDGYQEAYYWQQIEEKLNRLRSFSPNTWSEWHLVFQELRQHLHSLLHVLCERVAEAIPNIDAFRSSLAHSGCTNFAQHETVTDYKPKQDASPMFKRMYQLLRLLCSKQARHVLRPYNLSGEIDCLIKDHPGVSDLIDEWLSERLSHIADIVEVDDQLNGWQPHAAKASEMAAAASYNNDKKEIVVRDWRMKIDGYVLHHPLDPDAPELKCSIEVAETWEVLEQQKRSCEFMRDFWAGLDAEFRWTAGQRSTWEGKALPSAMRRLMLGAERLQYPWKGSTLKPPTQQSTSAGDNPSNLAEAFSSGEQANGPAILEDKDMNVVKTKGNAGAASLGFVKMSIAEEQQCETTPGKAKAQKGSNKLEKQTISMVRALLAPASQPPQQQAAKSDSTPTGPPPIPISAEAYGIAEVIFGKGRQGQITFDQFRAFMAAAGFSSKQRQSSSFLFQPQDSKVTGLRAVHFHHNHGRKDKKIDPAKLMNMAGDLKRNFGWDLGSFVAGGK